LLSQHTARASLQLVAGVCLSGFEVTEWKKLMQKMGPYFEVGDPNRPSGKDDGSMPSNGRSEWANQSLTSPGNLSAGCCSATSAEHALDGANVFAIGLWTLQTGFWRPNVHWAKAIRECVQARHYRKWLGAQPHVPVKSRQKLPPQRIR